MWRVFEFAVILGAFCGGWAWHLGGGFPPPWVQTFQTAIAEATEAAPAAVTTGRQGGDDAAPGPAGDEGAQATAAAPDDVAAEVPGEASESAASSVGAAANPDDADEPGEESRSRPAAHAARPEDSGSASDREP